MGADCSFDDISAKNGRAYFEILMAQSEVIYYDLVFDATVEQVVPVNLAFYLFGNEPESHVWRVG